MQPTHLYLALSIACAAAPAAADTLLYRPSPDAEVHAIEISGVPETIGSGSPYLRVLDDVDVSMHALLEGRLGEIRTDYSPRSHPGRRAGTERPCDITSIVSTDEFSLTFDAAKTEAASTPDGRIAFVADILPANGRGAPQDVLVSSDGQSIDILVHGCANGTGCGDPTPIGGTFSMLRRGSPYRPSMNAGGDVVFFSEVEGGPVSHGLFFYRRATDTVEKVAVPGDETPYGPIATVSAGVVNDEGIVVFVAEASPIAGPSYILTWKDGVLSPILSSGEVSPDGSSIYFLNRWFDSHGYVTPDGNLPDIDDAGRVVLGGRRFGGGVNYSAVFVFEASRSPKEWLRSGHMIDPGHVVNRVDWDALWDEDERTIVSTLNIQDELGTYSEWCSIQLTTNGSPYVRRIMGHRSMIDGEEVEAIAISRSGSRPLNALQELVAFYGPGVPGDWDRYMGVFYPDGVHAVVVSQFDIGPMGTNVFTFGAWPTLYASHGVYGAVYAPVPGNEIPGAYRKFTACRETVEVDVPGSATMPRYVHVAPNPSRATTMFALTSAPATGTLEAIVFDAAGRRVRSLETSRGGEAMTFTWDGRSDTGASTAPGMYFLVVRNGGDTVATARVSRIR